MELVFAAQPATGQLASDGQGPRTENPTTDGMAGTGPREPQAVLELVTTQRYPALHAHRTGVALSGTGRSNSSVNRILLPQNRQYLILNLRLALVAAYL